MCSIRSLSIFSKVAPKTVPMLVWLNTDHFRWYVGHFLSLLIVNRQANKQQKIKQNQKKTTKNKGTKSVTLLKYSFFGPRATLTVSKSLSLCQKTNPNQWNCVVTLSLLVQVWTAFWGAQFDILHYRQNQTVIQTEKTIMLAANRKHQNEWKNTVQVVWFSLCMQSAILHFTFQYAW